MNSGGIHRNLSMSETFAKPWKLSDAATALLDDFSDDSATVVAAISGIEQTILKTDLMDIFNDVVPDLLAYTANRRILLIASDGEHTVDSNRQAILDAAMTFKQTGGIIIVLGVRASGQGFDLLQRIASGGYFINAIPETAEESIELLNYLKSLLCAGSCIAAGDTFENLPSLHYSSFLNFEVIQGQVNLLGPGLMDFLPENGLYVELAGATTKGLIRTIDPISIVSGRTYRINFALAGNQRVSLAGQGVKVFVREVGANDADPNIFEQVIFPAYDADFQEFGFSFIPLSDAFVRLNFEQLGTSATPSAGNLLDHVRFEDTTTLTMILDDDFGEENSTYVGPNCGPSAALAALDAPDAPTAVRIFEGATPMAGDEIYNFGISYVTVSGETPVSTLLQYTAENEEDAFRVTIELPTDDRVTEIRVWRSLGADPVETDLFLLDTIPINQSVYLDSERRAAFEARYDDSTTAPTTNTTASNEGALGFGYADCCYYDVEDGDLVQTAPYMAFDQDSATFWSSEELPAQLNYQFDSAQEVGSYAITAGLVANAPTAWTFEGSTDGATWAVLDTQSAISWTANERKVFQIAFKCIDSSQPASYAYYRLNVSTVASSDFVTVKALELLDFQIVTATMTGNAAPSGVVSASSNDTNAWTAFNKDSALTFWSPSSALPQWLEYQFTAPVAVSAYGISICYDPDTAPSSWTLEGSTNGTDWVVLDTQTSVINVPEAGYDQLMFLLDEVATYEYFRLNVSEVATVTTLEIYELFLIGEAANLAPDMVSNSLPSGLASASSSGSYGTGAVATYEDRCPVCATEPPGVQSPDPSPLPDIESGYTPPVNYSSTKTVCATCPDGQQNVSVASLFPVMTSNTDPSGTITASVDDVIGPAVEAFDGEEGTNNGWAALASSPQWLAYEFASAQLVKSYRIVSAGGTAGPKDFKFQGSNNGSTWTDLDDKTNVSWYANESKRFSIDNATAYTHYRFYFTAAGGAAKYLIRELAVYASADSGQVCRTATETSFVSQSDADAKATAAATAAAEAELNCIGSFTATESFSATCPFNQYGASVTRSATRTSYLSQDDANAQAVAAAQVLAEADLDCTLSNNLNNTVINDNTKATPFPGVEYIEQDETSITKVVVNLNGLTHPSPDDIRILLIAPDGVTAVILMANCGGVALDGFPISNVNLVLDQTAGSALPDATQIVSGTFRPAAYGSGVVFPAPVPTGITYGTSLNDFIGLNPNGGWALFVLDDLSIFDGALASWSLTITAS